MSRVLDLIGAAHGQCRLSVASSSQLKLSPYNGRNLAIAGQLQRIPSSGVTVSNTGLAALTRYYVYAFMSSGAMALELSTTGHSQDTATGVEIKTGDATRTLVGMVVTDSDAEFMDEPTLRFCINWYNRRNLFGSLTVGTLTFTNSTLAEISGTLRLHFISWDDEAVTGIVDGTTTNSTAGQATYVQLRLTSLEAGALVQNNAFGANAATSFSSSTCGVVTEDGYYYYTVYGLVSGGTGSLVNPQLKLSMRG